MPHRFKKICKACDKGVLTTKYDYDIDALKTTCNKCSYIGIDYNKELHSHFVSASGEELS